MYKVKKGIDTMYYLRDEACTPIDFNRRRIQLDGRTAESQEDSRFEKSNDRIHGYFWSCGIAVTCEKYNKGTVKKNELKFQLIFCAICQVDKDGKV